MLPVRHGGFDVDYLCLFLQGENGDLKNRGGLKVDINHVSIPLGGKLASNSANNIADNFPDSSIGEGMDITIQGANGHVKHNTADNQSLKSYDSKTGNGGPHPPLPLNEQQPTPPTIQQTPLTAPLPCSNGNGGILSTSNEKLNHKYSDISIGKRNF